MVLRRAAALLCLVSLAAAHSISQPSAAVHQPSAGPQQPSAATQQLSAAEQLSALLGPAVESAVLRALAAERAAQQQCAADAGQRALDRLEQRLDVLTRDVTALQTALDAVQGGVTPAREETPNRSGLSRHRSRHCSRSRRRRQSGSGSRRRSPSVTSSQRLCRRARRHTGSQRDAPVPAPVCSCVTRAGHSTTASTGSPGCRCRCSATSATTVAAGRCC